MTLKQETTLVITTPTARALLLYLHSSPQIGEKKGGLVFPSLFDFDLEKASKVPVPVDAGTLLWLWWLAPVSGDAPQQNEQTSGVYPCLSTDTSEKGASYLWA